MGLIEVLAKDKDRSIAHDIGIVHFDEEGDSDVVFTL